MKRETIDKLASAFQAVMLEATAQHESVAPISESKLDYLSKVCDEKEATIRHLSDENYELRWKLINQDIAMRELRQEQAERRRCPIMNNSGRQCVLHKGHQGACETG